MASIGRDRSKQNDGTPAHAHTMRKVGSVTMDGKTVIRFQCQYCPHTETMSTDSKVYNPLQK